MSSVYDTPIIPSWLCNEGTIVVVDFPTKRIVMHYFTLWDFNCGKDFDKRLAMSTKHFQARAATRFERAVKELFTEEKNNG